MAKEESAKFDQYEYVGVIAPGVALLLGVLYLAPDLVKQFHLGKDGLDIVGLALLLLAAFVVGHLLQGIGEFVELIIWRLLGGWPTEWVLRKKSNLLSEGQRNELHRLLKEKLRVDIDGTVNRKEWWVWTRQIYLAVRKANVNQRIDAFNRTYGFCRGLGAAFLVLLVIVIALGQGWSIAALVFGLGAIIAFVRMVAFGISYGRELMLAYIEVTKTP